MMPALKITIIWWWKTTLIDEHVV